MKPQRTPLHAWLGRKLGLAPGQDPNPDNIAAYQLAKLRQAIAYARAHSPFYGERLSGLPAGFPDRLADLARLPFTTAEDLRRQHLAMLCVSQDQVVRVVTLRTSGTTATPKRVYFSDSDLELTLDFFHHGMSTLVEPGGCVLILLPGSTPDSVGDLLARALVRMQVRSVVHGPLGDPGGAIAEALSVKADCLVGIPVQVLAMAEHPQAARLKGVIKSILLTTDYVPRAIAARIHRAWGCEIFEHYGMTETGLGGGVDCRAHAGYHLRGADLYYEVVDPETGEPLAPGQEGELVVSTLTRQAMPLLRYRTGDWGRLLSPEGCPCGGVTPRLDRVPGRLANKILLPGGEGLAMGVLDEALFAVPGLMDYRAHLQASDQVQRLKLIVQAAPNILAGWAQEVTRAAGAVPVVQRSLASSSLTFGQLDITTAAWASDGSIKRNFD
jgi:phenylacetate-coenzyme A ligase PaaK-like adenylate-forming protein